MGLVIVNSQGQIEISNDYNDKTLIGVVSDFNLSSGAIEVNLFPYLNNYENTEKTDSKINSRFDILDIR